MMPSRRSLWLLLAATYLLLAPGRGLAQSDPCALPGPVAVVELGGDESGIGGTGRSGDESGIGGTGRSEDESGIGGTGRSGDESGLGGTGIAAHESGLGGTGVSDDSSGIGGTGIYGTLTAFGSVCVNGLRVHYPEDVEVERNGQRSNLSALALGQVLWVVAGGEPGDLSARKIAIHSAVVGEVSGVDRANRRLVVSGRAVSVPEGARLGEGLRFAALEIGDRVDVSGLRNADGEIVASRIDVARPRESDVPEAPSPEVLAAAAAGLQWISVEGYVTGRPERPRVGGIALDLTAVGGLPDRVRPGRRVRARGRLQPDGVLRVEPRVRHRPALAPAGSVPRSEIVPDTEVRKTPQAPPKPEVRVKPQTPPKPEVRVKPEAPPKLDVQRPPARPLVPRPPQRPKPPVPMRPDRPRSIRPRMLDARPLSIPRR